jgi:hypothetical protein
VAQLGARLDGIEEVRGSNPLGSTKFPFITKDLSTRLAWSKFHDGACVGFCVGLRPVEDRDRFAQFEPAQPDFQPKGKAGLGARETLLQLLRGSKVRRRSYFFRRASSQISPYQGLDRNQ